MTQFKLIINNQEVTVDADGDMPLLWAIRDFIGLTGTKYGCGISQCGACSVHMEGRVIRSCSVPVSACAQKKIVTIEGIDSLAIQALRQAWLEEDVPQCGYCQSGQLMTAAAFLEKNNSPSEEDIVRAMSGNLCRCGTYQRIKKAIQKASQLMTNK
jgi:isoquinoline 1-oxidoreductase alpha subunit